MRLDCYLFLSCKDFLDGELLLHSSDFSGAPVQLRNILRKGQPCDHTTWVYIGSSVPFCDFPFPTNCSS